MNIGFFNSNKEWGGGEKWHFEIASNLQKKGHNVTLFCNRESELYKKSADHKLHIVPVIVGNLSFLNIFKVVTIAFLLKKNNIEYLIINLPSDLKVGGIAGRLARLKKIIYRRGSAIPVKNSFSNKLIFRYLVDGIIANSYATKTTILQHNQRLFPSQKIKVIYNGIDLNKFDSSTNKKSNKKSNQITIGNLGRLVKQKNQMFLIDIIEKLRNDSLNVELIIGGDGELKEKIEYEIKSRKLEKHIRLVGFVEHVKEFMEQIDIFVLPSLWEGFGYVLIEAQACKKPVVAFNLSSNPEVIDDKESGFLVDHNKTDEFVSRLKQLIEDDTLRQKMGKTARNFVEKKFRIENTLAGVENFLLAD